MRCLVHISDLHFGRTDDAVIEPLVHAISSIAPDVVVVSGDLTQRARAAQFQQARRFLDRLPRPQIVVPGNHDVPLHDVLGRFLSPLTKYRRYVTADLEPFHVDDEIAVLGMNTARSLTVKGGRVNGEQLARAHERLGALPASVAKIIVTHHPFDLPAGHAADDLVGGAHDAMAVFANAGADLLLAGHLHVTRTATTAARYEIDGHAALVIQAGTATSTRVRGEVNSFNVIRIDAAGAIDAVGRRVVVERFNWDASKRAFAWASTESFTKTARVWALATSVVTAATEGSTPPAADPPTAAPASSAAPRAASSEPPAPLRSRGPR